MPRQQIAYSNIQEIKQFIDRKFINNTEMIAHVNQSFISWWFNGEAVSINCRIIAVIFRFPVRLIVICVGAASISLLSYDDE